MPLSNAERQRRFRERLKANANGSLYDVFVRERRETILAWMQDIEPGSPEHCALTAMLESPDGGINAERLSVEFSELVGQIVRRERKAMPRKRRTRAEIAADRERERRGAAELSAWRKEQGEQGSVT